MIYSTFDVSAHRQKTKTFWLRIIWSAVFVFCLGNVHTGKGNIDASGRMHFPLITG